MNFPQTTYDQFNAEALEGMVTEGHFGNFIDSGTLEGTSNSARGMVTGSGYGLVKVPTGTTYISAHFQGVSVYQSAKMPQAGAAVRYADGDTVPCLKKGRIWVLAQGDMVLDGPVYCVHSGADAGKFRGDNTTATIVAGAICRKAALTGALALIELNLP